MYIRILTILLLLSSYSFAQTEQIVESLALGSYLSPLVKVQKDGKQFWYHLDGDHWIDKVDEHAGGMFVVIKDGRYGVLKEDGNLIVPFEYDEIKIDTKYKQPQGKNQYEYKFILLKKDGKTGVADENGNIILPVQYENAKGISKNAIGFAENGLWGWASAKDGSILHQPEHAYIRDFYSADYVGIGNGNTSGLAKTNGEVIIPPEYMDMCYIETGKQVLFVGYDKEKKAYLFDTTGTVVVSGHVTYNALDHTDLISYREKNDLWGILDLTSKQTVIPATYENLRGFVRGLSVVKKAGKQGVIKADGKELLSCEYDEIRLLNAEGMPRFSAESVPQISAPVGDFHIPDERTAERSRKNEQYEAEIERAPYLIEVRKEQQRGIYDWNGRAVIPIGKYDEVQPHYYNGKTFYMLYANNKIGLADESGNEILPVQYSTERNYQYYNYLANDDFHLSSRFVPFSAGKEKENSYNVRIGLFDLERKKIIVEPQDQRITLLNNRFIYVRSGLENYQYKLLLYDFIEHKTQKLPDDVIDLGIMEDNQFLLLKLKNKLYRLTDVAGNLIYENPTWKTEGSYNLIRFPEYVDHSRGEFYHGLKKVYADEGNLFIDESGKEKRFDGIDQVDDFYAGFAVAAKKVADETSPSGFRYKKGFIDINCNEILPFEFDEVTATGKYNAFLKFRKEGVEGVVRRDGTVVFEPVYEDIGYSGSGDRNLVVYKNGKYGLADTSGKILVEPLFDELRKNYDGEEKTWPVMVKQGEWYYFVGKDGKKYPIKAKRKG